MPQAPMLFVSGLCVIALWEQKFPISLQFPGPSGLSRCPSVRLVMWTSGLLPGSEARAVRQGPAFGRTPRLEGPHTWLNTLLSLSWNSSSFLKKRPPILILYYALQSFSGVVYGCLLYFFFYPFKFYISTEWIQSYCRRCRSFINFSTWFKIRAHILVRVCRAHIFPSASGPCIAWCSSGLEPFLIVTTKECYWHLVGAGQGRC